MTTDLEQAGLVGNSGESEKLPEEMMDQEFLDSPLGRIMQALAVLELAAQSMQARISQCETYITYLLAKDPVVGPRIAAMAKATKDGGINLGEAGITVQKETISVVRGQDGQQIEKV